LTASAGRVNAVGRFIRYARSLRSGIASKLTSIAYSLNSTGASAARSSQIANEIAKRRRGAHEPSCRLAYPIVVAIRRAVALCYA
jgi:hypothetical protein